MGISVITITYNEERNITDCLESVKWADEVIIVDAHSSDHTREIAQRYTNKIYQTKWVGYSEAKSFALNYVINDWVLWIDADERVTPELAREIQTLLKFPNTFAGYEVGRKAYFLGRWIQYCGWYPGYVVRLFKRGGAQFTSSKVHEKINLNGPIGRLKNDLIHLTDDTLYHYFNKFNRYTTLAAQELLQAGKKFSLYDILIRPLFMFIKMYFVRLGFLDGMHGLILSMLSSAYVFTKYAKLWDIARTSDSKP